MDSEAAQMFYKICNELKADTEKERCQILLAMAKMGYISSVSVTSRSIDKVVEDYSKHFNVLDARPGKENNDGDSETSS
jgi:hypothetical protein